MATFTTVSKNRLSWTAPPPSEASAEAYELLIADGFYLDIGGFKLTITPANAPIQYTFTSKNSVTWPSSNTTAGADQHLDIGAGYNLLVSDDYKLIIDPARSGTNWTLYNK